MKDAVVTFRLTNQEKEALKEEADFIGMTISQLVRKIVSQHLKGE